jgi:signal transduction histidine kinase/CheY-like chemotaxis protein
LKLSIESRLTLLVVAAITPLVAFAAGLVIWHSQTEQRVLHQDASRTAEATMQAIDREVSGVIAGLQVLAASPALVAKDFVAFQAQARAAVGIAGNSVIMLYDREGNRIVSSAVPYGQPLPPRKDMSQFTPPFTTGKPHVMRLFISETVHRPTVGVVVPVALNGEVTYVLSAGILSDGLSERLAASAMPAGWIAALLDQEGTVIARTKNQTATIGRKLPPESWEHIQEAGGTGTAQGATLEGAQVFLTFTRSRTSGWTTVVGIPMSALEGQLHTSLSLVGATGTVIFLLAMLLAWQAARQIYGPASQLEDCAKALEKGEVIKVPPTGIWQFDRLAATMYEAGGKIQDREKQLSQSLAELRHAHGELKEEHERKDRFIATLAHELRNPLAPIRTGVYVLGKSPPPKVVEKTLAMMDRQLTHIVRLVDDLMDVSRIARGKVVLQKEPAVLQQVLANAVEDSQPFLTSGGQRFTLDLPKEPIWVPADPVRLSQVLTNILHNAVKFTPPEGSITLSAALQGDSAEVRVTDTGVGIPPDKLADVFDLFSQVKDDGGSSQPGLGIGLSLARLLIDLHGGTITAHSEGTGCGVTVVVRLPVCQNNEAASVIPLHGRLANRSLRVLVVDDNADAAESLAMALRVSGHSALVARDGASALEIAKDFDADLALLDIGMPEMDGHELCRRLRQLPGYSGKKIIAVTGWGADCDRKASQDAGFDAHLTKPVDWSQIEQVLYGW